MDSNPAQVENTLDHIELDRSQSSLSTPQKSIDIIDVALEDIGAFATSVSLTGSGDELVGRLKRLASYQPKYFEQATAELLLHHRGCHLGCVGREILYLNVDPPKMYMTLLIDRTKQEA